MIAKPAKPAKTAAKLATAATESAEEVWHVSGGKIDLGEISAEAAAQLGFAPGPIRLPEGRREPGGYGRIHIQENASRIKQIKGLGFKSAAEFVAAIAANWTQVVAAKEPNRLVLVYPKDGYGLQLVVQRHDRGGVKCWSVVTAVPGRKAKATDVLFSKK